jgi:hypothetical protein
LYKNYERLSSQQLKYFSYLKGVKMKFISRSFLLANCILGSTALMASSYGLGSDFSAGKTTQPSMFGVVHGNPAELRIQQNLKYFSAADKEAKESQMAECQTKQKAYEADCSNIDELKRLSMLDAGEGNFITDEQRKKVSECKVQEDALEDICQMSEAHSAFAWQLFNLGLGVEWGDLNKIQDDITKYKLDETPEDVQAIYDYIGNMNDFFDETGDNMYMSANFNIDVLSPLIFKVGDNSFSLGVDFRQSIKGVLLGQDVNVYSENITKIAQELIKDENYLLTDEGKEDFVGALKTTSSIYIKTSTIARAHLGYARDVWYSDYGVLNVGARANMYKIRLAKELLPFKEYVEDEISGKDMTDRLQDDLEDLSSDYSDTTALGLDIGASWQAENYTLGVYIANVNEPEADYPVMGSNCADIDNELDRDDCYYAIGLSGVIDIEESYKMEMVPTITGSVNDKSNRWRLSFAYDMSEAKTPIGEYYQWASVNLGYSARVDRQNWYHYLLPDWRIGVNQNLSGNNIMYYTAGLGFYGFNLDLMFDKEFLSDPESSQGFGISISSGFNF